MPRFRRRGGASAGDTEPLPRIEHTTPDWPEREEVVEYREPGPPPPPGPPDRAIWPWLLLLLVLVLAGLGALWLLQNDDEPERGAGPQDTATVTVEETAPTEPTGTEPTGTRTNGTTTGAATTAETDAQPARVAVPNVVGLTIAAAVDRLGEAGFEVRDRGVFSEEPEGRVVAQAPAARERAERGSAVRINYSQGTKRVPVPEVLGLTEAEAKARLRSAGFAANVFEVPASEPKGVVVAQNPPPGAEAARKTVVRINISTGAVQTTEGERTTTEGEETDDEAQPPPPPRRVSVPDLVDRRLPEARRELRALGLAVRVTYVPSREPRGTVVAQRPTPGKSVLRGSGVRLNVSIGPQQVQQVQVPDVLGLTEEEAVQELEAAGFQVEVVPEPTPDEAEQGVVIGQDPEPGGTAPRGELVVVYVGQFEGTETE